MIALLLLVFVLFVCASHMTIDKRVNQCNRSDKLIYKKTGHEFKALFRTFGGLWVTRNSYIAKVMDATSLSYKCSQCYGDAYICGYKNCKWNCIEDGEKCDACLIKHKCIEECNKCTGL